MKKSIVRFLGAVACATVFVACNGSNSIYNPPGTGSNCGSPPNSLQVLYPRPGAQAAPDSLVNVFVATNGPLPSNNSFNFQLNSTVPLYPQFTSNFFATSASKIPSPHATPSFANPTYYATTLATPPGPANTVQLFWN